MHCPERTSCTLTPQQGNVTYGIFISSSKLTETSSMFPSDTDTANFASESLACATILTTSTL